MNEPFRLETLHDQEPRPLAWADRTSLSGSKARESDSDSEHLNIRRPHDFRYEKDRVEASLTEDHGSFVFHRDSLVVVQDMLTNSSSHSVTLRHTVTGH